MTSETAAFGLYNLIFQVSYLFDIISFLAQTSSYKEYDNQLHELHIAKNYWKNVINIIKTKERAENELLETTQTDDTHLEKRASQKEN